MGMGIIHALLQHHHGAQVRQVDMRRSCPLGNQYASTRLAVKLNVRRKLLNGRKNVVR